MTTDSRLEIALREALDARAALVEPDDRLDEILRRSDPALSGRTPRWWMPLAAAAAVLAVVTGVWIGLAGPTEPVPGGSPTPLPTASPSATTSSAPVLTPTTEAPPPTTAAPPSPTSTSTPSTSVLAVYVISNEVDSEPSLKLGLRREWVRLQAAADPASRVEAAVREAMTRSHDNGSGSVTMWAGAELDGVVVTADRIVIDFDTVPEGAPGTPAEQGLAIQQLVWTAQAAVGRGNLPVEFRSPTNLLFEASARGEFQRPGPQELWRDLADIWITSPTREQVLPTGRVTVTGEASVFEATVSWQLLRDGTVVDEGFTTASIGAPGRGTYEIALGRLAPGEYAIRVYATSAEDGAVTSAEERMPFTVR